MKGYFYLMFNKKISVIVFGEKQRNNEITFKCKPGFFDAIKFSDPSPSIGEEVLLQNIPLTSITTETFHFHDPLSSQKFKCIIGYHSLILFENDKNMSTAEVFNIFNYFLIKQGSRMLFLVNLPNSKIKKSKNDEYLFQNREKRQEKDE